MEDLRNHEAFRALETAVREEAAEIAALRKSYTDHLRRVHEALAGLARETEPEQAEAEPWSPQTVEKLAALNEVLESMPADGNAARVEALESELAQVNTALSDARAHLEAVQDELQQRSAAESAATERLTTLESELAEARANAEAEAKRAQQLEEQLQQREAGQAEVEQLQQEREALQAANQELATERDAVRAEAERIREHAETVEQQLREEKAKGTKSVLAEQLAEALKDAEGAREELRAVRRELEKWRRKQQPQQAPEAAQAESVEPLDTGEQTDVSAALEEPGELDTTIANPAPETAESPVVPEQDPEKVARLLSEAAGQEAEQAPTVGDLLVRAGLLSQAQLDEAVAELRSDPSRQVGAVLVDKGFVSEDAVAQALAVQYDVGRVHLASEPIDSAAAALIPQRLAQQHQCIPLQARDDTLVVAIANPMNVVAIEDIERASNRQVEVRVATPSEIRQAIERFFPPSE